jgi:hypothetical protein
MKLQKCAGLLRNGTPRAARAWQSSYPDHRQSDVFAVAAVFLKEHTACTASAYHRMLLRLAHRMCCILELRFDVNAVVRHRANSHPGLATYASC